MSKRLRALTALVALFLDLVVPDWGLAADHRRVARAVQRAHAELEGSRSRMTTSISPTGQRQLSGGSGRARLGTRLRPLAVAAHGVLRPRSGPGSPEPSSPCRPPCRIGTRPASTSRSSCEQPGWLWTANRSSPICYAA